MAAATPPPLSPADLIRQALTDRTTAEKSIASAELPQLQAALDALNGPEMQAVLDKLKPLLDAIGPSQSNSMLTNIPMFVAQARQTLPQDIARHQHTLTL